MRPLIDPIVTIRPDVPIGPSSVPRSGAKARVAPSSISRTWSAAAYFADSSFRMKKIAPLDAHSPKSRAPVVEVRRLHDGLRQLLRFCRSALDSDDYPAATESQQRLTSGYNPRESRQRVSPRAATRKSSSAA